MQKLLQRRPYSVPAIFSSNSYPRLFSLNVLRTLKPSSPLCGPSHHRSASPLAIATVSFSRRVASHTSLISPTFHTHELRMPAPTAIQPLPGVSLAADTFRIPTPLSLQRVSLASNCGACPSSIDVGARVVRPWVVLRKSQGGSRLAWLHTAAGSGDGSASAKTVEGSSGVSEEDAGSAAAGAEQEKGGNSDEKPVKFHRRRRGGTGNVASGLEGSPDLLTIPGVGPRNLRKLVDKGIGKVGELKQLYKDKFLGKSSDKMVEYLQDSVGIIHKNHAESITTFIKESVDEELKEDDGSSLMFPKKRITLCVEGNISVGKTTFLKRIASETFELQDLVEIVPEPIDKWQNIGPDHFNILNAFYAEPQRYAYTFQNYVFVTRVMQERESSGGIKPLRLMERSVFTDRMVFVRAVHEAKWMNEMEISIYDSWFDPVVSSLPGLIPDGFIYLRASPDTCHKRMMLRNRSEEGGVSLDYLRDLHEKHESWLFPSETGNHGVLAVNKLPFSVDSSLHPDIRDRVIYLEGSHMHPSIQKVPALVLDCEANIDFNRDVEAKKHYARQIAEFFKFVKKSKELESPETSDEAAKKAILGSNKPPLWGPDGKQLLNLPFNSIDFNRSMSFLSG